MPDIKSMSLPEAQAYKQQLKDSGKTLSTSKEMGKVENYIKTLSPEKYGSETVDSAYKSLSSGVTEYGGWTAANVGELDARGIPNMLGQGSTKEGGDLNTYLDGYQNSVYGASNNIELRDSIVNQVEPDQGLPDTVDWSDMNDAMREDYGVVELEASLNDLNTQLEDTYAQRRLRTQDAEGKPVAMGVIAGRVGEIERQENERIDAIGRQINVITRQLNTAYSAISMYMEFERMEYDDAVNKYKMEFDRNLQIYNLIDDEMDEITAAAKSNLQLYQNAIISGNISYGSLSSSQKSFIAGLEVQAGMPVGFTASLNPDEKVLYSGTREEGGTKYLDIITQGANGQPITNTIALGGTGGGDGATGDVKSSDVAAAITIIKAQPSDNPTDEGDKSLSPNEISQIMEDLIEKFGDKEYAAEVFSEATKQYGYNEWEG